MTPTGQVKVEGEGEQWKSMSCALCAYRKAGLSAVHLHLSPSPDSNTKGTAKMAAKTKTITVQVDERLASEIEGTTVHNWRTTTFASGKRRVYATFESVKTVGGMK